METRNLEIKKDNPTKQRKFRSFLKEHRAILIVLLLVLAIRLIALDMLGAEYSLSNDDLAYVRSGITFRHTGMITMHENDVPSAQIMPGLTVLIGLFSFVFGEGTRLWLALKLLWACMGTLTGWFIYKSVRIYAPKWCGVVAVIPLIRADFVWMDNLILTETPFIFCFSIMIYCTLMMGKTRKGKYFWGCLVAYMLALMCKANIAPYPVFAMVYLLLVKYDFKRLLRQGLILGGVVLCFIIPWSIRNYIQFDTFVPLTYGVGNPRLLGTYQGYGYPSDEELDYETHVEEVVKEKYARYYNEDGSVKTEYIRFVNLGRDNIKASYRIQEWAKRDWKSMVISYGVIKPMEMIRSSFYWTTLFNVTKDQVLMMQDLNTVLCAVAVALAVVLKKYRRQMCFLLLVYFGNLYVYAATFSFDRYQVSLMPIRYIIIGIGLGLGAELFSRGVAAVRDRRTEGGNSPAI